MYRKRRRARNTRNIEQRARDQARGYGYAPVETRPCLSEGNDEEVDGK